MKLRIGTINRIGCFLFIILSLNLLINLSALSQCRELTGVVSSGGIFNNGAIFKTDENGDNLTFLYSSDKGVKGATPHGNLCEAGNGKLYGMTAGGGPAGRGTVFEWD